MQKFRVVYAGKSGGDRRAVVCAEHAVQFAVNDLGDQGYMVLGVIPAECHWTAQIVPSREFSDWDQRTEA